MCIIYYIVYTFNHILHIIFSIQFSVELFYLDDKTGKISTIRRIAGGVIDGLPGTPRASQHSILNILKSLVSKHMMQDVTD